MEKIRVMLVGNDHDWQRSLSDTINRESDIEAVKIVNTSKEAVMGAASGKIDVIVMDATLSGHELDGLEVAREIISKWKNKLKIIMLTSNSDRDVILRSFRSGAVNHMNKSSYDDIVRGIRDAYHNQSAIHADVAAIIRKELQLMALTPTEREVYELRSSGYTKRQIASQLFKSENTIKTQIKSIRNKLLY